MSSEGKAKLVMDLRQAEYVDLKADGFYRIDIDDKLGGTRSLETFLFRSQRLEDGRIVVVTACFSCSEDLAATWKFMVKNHRQERIHQWLDYKLFKHINN